MPIFQERWRNARIWISPETRSETRGLSHCQDYLIIHLLAQVWSIWTSLTIKFVLKDLMCFYLTLDLLHMSNFMLLTGRVLRRFVFLLLDNPLKGDSVKTFFRIIEMNHCPQLQCINLSGIAMNSDVSTTFATMIRSGTFAYLEELYLAECSLNLDSIKHLCNAIADTPLQLLHTLSLAQNRLNSSCICALCCILQKQKLPSLRELDLSSNKIGNDGVKQFADNNKDQVLTQVEILNLSDNGISNEGAFVIFDSVRHRIWSNLHDLNLEKNKFSAVTAVQLRSLLEMDNDLDTIRLTDMTKRRAATPSYRHLANNHRAGMRDSSRMNMEDSSRMNMGDSSRMNMGDSSRMNMDDRNNLHHSSSSSTSVTGKPPEVIPLEIPSTITNVVSESLSTPIAFYFCCQTK